MGFGWSITLTFPWNSIFHRYFVPFFLNVEDKMVYWGVLFSFAWDHNQITLSGLVEKKWGLFVIDVAQKQTIGSS